MFVTFRAGNYFRTGTLALLAVLSLASFSSLLFGQSQSEPLDLPGTRAIIQQTKLRLPDLGGSDADIDFAHDVTLSADGSTALVTGYKDETPGETHVFVRSGASWSRQAILVAEQTGDAVDLSADGNTALIGGYIFRRSGTTWTQQIRFSSEGNFLFSGALSDDGSVAVAASTIANGTENISGAAYVFVYDGTTWTQQAKLIASDGKQNDEFGTQIDVNNDGSTVIIGAPNARTETTAATGAAYIFKREGITWTQQAKLVANEPLNAYTNYGSSVALDGSGDLALVSAPKLNKGLYPAIGAVFAFTRSGSTWTQQAKLEAPAAAQTNSDAFGTTLDLSDNGQTAVISAVTVGLGDGTVYIFTREDSIWTERKQLPDPARPLKSFGAAAAISDDGGTVMIGSPSENTPVGLSAGAVYVYTGSEADWQEQARLTSVYLEGEGKAGDQFGYSVAMSADGNTAAIGMPYDDTELGLNVGAVFIYTRSGSVWTQQAKLRAADGTTIFGLIIHMSNDGNTLLITQQGEIVVYTRSGTTWTQQAKLIPPIAELRFVGGKALSGDSSTILASVVQDEGNIVYVYQRSGNDWNLQAELPTPSDQYNDNFGSSVALSNGGNTALVSASYTLSSNFQSGVAYAYTRNNGTWSGPTLIEVNDPDLKEPFAQKVTLSGDGNTALMTSSEAVYRFTRTNGIWTQQNKTLLTDSNTNTEITGIALNMDGTVALAGVVEYTSFPGEYPLTPGSASRIQYDGNDFTVETFVPENVVIGALFGYDVAASEDLSTMLIGAPGDILDTGDDAGSVFVYTVDDSVVTPTHTATHTAVVTSTHTPTNTMPATSTPTQTPVASVTPTSTVSVPASPTTVVTDLITATPTTPSPVTTELVQNGDFESANGLAPWTIKDSSGDKLKCKADKPIANSGTCAFQFANNGDGSGALSQKLDSSTLSAGDIVHFSLYVRSKGDAGGKAKVVFKYSDGSEGVTIIDLSNAIGQYLRFEAGEIVLSGEVAKIKLTVKSIGSSGKLYIDDVSLTATDNSSAVLSLPGS